MNLRLGFVAVLALFTLVAIGCSDLGEPLRLEPQPAVSATSLDFGTVAVGGSATRQVTVTNAGTADFSGAASLSCAGFAIEDGEGPFSVPPGGAHDVVVRFEPGSAGAFMCGLSLGGGLPPVALNAQASNQLPGSQCVVTPTSLDFGSLAVGGSRLGNFKIQNPGTAPTSLDVVPDCGSFSVVSGGGPSMLAPGDSLTVTVSFAPAQGGAVECRIATGPGCPEVTVRGTGTTVSFSNHILPIFNARGCNSGCHTRLFNSTASIVNVTTQGYAPARYIVPFDLSGSVIYGKVTDSGQYGQSMPQGSPLIPIAERNRIRDWILEGALNN